MKRIAIVLGLLFVVGCGASPIQKVTAAQRLYTSGVNSFTVAIESGRITNKDVLRMARELIVEADAALDEARMAAIEGKNPVTWQLVWNRANNALDKLLIFLATHVPKETACLSIQSQSPSASRSFAVWYPRSTICGRAES